MPALSTMTSPQPFRLSYWHLEVARLIGEGLPNREIKKHIKISDSRLSILRANPLIRRAAERYRQMHEDKYRKALEVFADGAADTASTVVGLVKNPLLPGNVRLAAAQVVLENASYLSPEGKAASGGGAGPGVESFEMMLRVTKRGSGAYEQDQPLEFNAEHVERELLTDVAGVDPDADETDLPDDGNWGHDPSEPLDVDFDACTEPPPAAPERPLPPDVNPKLVV